MNTTRLVVAGLSGDSGKTLVSLSLVTALKQKGFSVSVFKKGPDYIDAAWLTWASGSVCRNLDTFMVSEDRVRDSFARHAQQSDFCVIEGNRGVFDGSDADGTHSTAGLARLLGAPVILVVDCTKTTRTVAALVKGCQVFDPELVIAGVVLNKVAGQRHEEVVRASIEKHCNLPVFGSIPKQRGREGLIPGRHLGLVTPAEYDSADQLQGLLREIGEKYLDVDSIVRQAKSASLLPGVDDEATTVPSPTVRVGYFRDSVFTFYYPENLEALEKQGAELVPVSSLVDTSLPELDALYIGGGFPETHASQLANNRSLMAAVRDASESGLPIYSECGGLIYLSRSVAYEGKRFPMSGVFEIDLELSARPVGHGYAVVKIDRACPFFEKGTTVRGHEFHYSGPVGAWNEAETCMSVERGVGLGQGRDGLSKNNTVGCYTHLHALGAGSWARTLVKRAREYKDKRGAQSAMNKTADDVPKVRDKRVLTDNCTILQLGPPVKSESNALNSFGGVAVGH